jgi:hypothetical protein
MCERVWAGMRSQGAPETGAVKTDISKPMPGNDQGTDKEKGEAP